MLLGEDPFYRERIWNGLKERQRLNLSSLPDRVLTAIDLALWDLAGQVLGQPVHRLLGASRDKVPAYASTMVGDDLEGGLDTPEAYARFARQCQARGSTRPSSCTRGNRRTPARRASNATSPPAPPFAKRSVQTYR